MSDVIVIGGGAAGMAAAITAAECGDHVILLERMDRVGKKLLATGNGRCNLMNTRPWQEDWNGSSLATQVMQHCGYQAQQRFWQAHGLLLREEDGGRVYPASGQASTVLDVLRLALDNLGVEIHTSTTVSNLVKVTKKWSVKTDVGSFMSDRVIIAGGGCAQPKLGSNGSCYTLLEALGHKLIHVRPALTQIETDTNLIRGLSGIRVKCEVQVLSPHNKLLHAEEGEALFTDYGLSGVCVMQCAAYAVNNGRISLDLLKGIGIQRSELVASLAQRKRQWGSQPLDNLLTGICVPRLSSAIGRAAGVIYRDRTISVLRPEEIECLADVMTSFTLKINGIKGFDSAQVTAGGIDVCQFDAFTMASMLAKGIHAAGEVLDVDGTCGGYNLMFAFGSGILAGLNGRPNPYGGNT